MNTNSIIPRMQSGNTGLIPFYVGCEHLFFKWFNDPKIYLHMGDLDAFPISLENCKQYVESHKKDTWLIVTTDNDIWTPIGYAGMFIRGRHRVGIIRYAIGENFFLTKGHATRAVQLYLSWAFNEADLEVVIASVSSSNPESERVLQKSGFSQCGKYSNVRFEDGKRYDEIHYQINKIKYHEKN